MMGNGVRNRKKKPEVAASGFIKCSENSRNKNIVLITIYTIFRLFARPEAKKF
jgi:hypothetical protein